ncbi:MAG: hypothetical protein GTO37_11930 [Planctomycetales bacterium]|nr:hypothetical protein [Planctomycetales bacterium]
MRSKTFRFDGAPEPESGFSFISDQHIADTDLVIDLRDEFEAPRAAHPSARRATVDTIHEIPNTPQRTVICCATGLRAWRAAERLKPHWRGEIVLAALGPT